MPSVDDPQRFGERLQKERRRLQEADIPEEDRDAITRFMHGRSGSLEASSLLVYVNHLRRASDMADMPPAEMDRDDVSALLFDLQHNEEYGRGGGGYAASTVKTFRDILVVFFGWLDRDFHEDIDRIKVEDQTVTDDTVLTPGDVQDLIEAARYQRDIALIDFLADTGARLSLVASLRVGDVELDRVDDGRHNTTMKACQECKEPVELTEPHVFARGWRQAPTGRVYFWSVFCIRRCWAEWASSGP